MTHSATMGLHFRCAHNVRLADMKMDVLVSDHRRIEVVAKGLCPLVRPNLMQMCTPVKLFKEPPDANAIRPTLSSQEGATGSGCSPTTVPRTCRLPC